jgi:hypothetical protein
VVRELAFVGPVSTGLSRVVAGEKPADCHGYQAGVRHLAELIRVWISRGGRWPSRTVPIRRTEVTCRRVNVRPPAGSDE